MRLCMYLCMFVLYALPNRPTDRHETLGHCSIYSRDGFCEVWCRSVHRAPFHGLLKIPWYSNGLLFICLQRTDDCFKRIEFTDVRRFLFTFKRFVYILMFWLWVDELDFVQFCRIIICIGVYCNILVIFVTVFFSVYFVSIFFSLLHWCYKCVTFFWANVFYY
jgi:hypothetical protein